MVTIGPLIVLGILGVTFRIGARLVATLEPEVLTVPQTPTIHQSDNNACAALESLTPTPVLQRARTSEMFTEDFPRVMELPRFGPALKTGRSSGGSEDSIALSRSQIPTSRAGASVRHHRPAGLEMQLSGMSSSSASLHDATVNRQNGPIGHTVQDEAGYSAPPTHERPSLGTPQRSPLRTFDTGTGTEADPEQVTTNPAMSLWDLPFDRTLCYDYVAVLPSSQKQIANENG